MEFLKIWSSECFPFKDREEIDLSNMALPKLCPSLNAL